MSLQSVESYSDKQHRAAQRFLDSLDHLDQRTDSHYATVRRSTRRKYRGQVLVLVPSAADSPDDANPVEPFRVFARSISETGISFISPFAIHAQRIYVGIELPQEGVLWFDSEVMRSREYKMEGFWEYGIAFRERAHI